MKLTYVFVFLCLSIPAMSKIVKQWSCEQIPILASERDTLTENFNRCVWLEEAGALFFVEDQKLSGKKQEGDACELSVEKAMKQAELQCRVFAIQENIELDRCQILGAYGVREDAFLGFWESNECKALGVAYILPGKD